MDGDERRRGRSARIEFSQAPVRGDAGARPLKAGAAFPGPITDPDNIPVKVVNGMPQYGVLGGLVVMTLTTARIGVGADGAPNPDMVIAARLRFDLEMAIAMRNALNSQIDLLSGRKIKPN